MNKHVRILLTGANGQVGQAFRKICKEIDWIHLNPLTKSDLDISDAEGMERQLKGMEFDFCINAAAYTQVDLAETEKELCYKINAESAGNLAKICKAHQAVLIHFSSDYVYHPNHQDTLSESSPTNPRGIYAKSKLKGEQLISEILDRHVIIRTSWVFDCSNRNFVTTMLLLGKEKDHLTIVHDQVGSPSYTEDVAKGVIEIIHQICSNPSPGQFGIFNFSNEGFVSWAEFAEEIFRISKLNVRVERIDSNSYPTPAKRPGNSRMSKEKIKKAYGIHPPHWKNSLEKCLKDKS